MTSEGLVLEDDPIDEAEEEKMTSERVTEDVVVEEADGALDDDEDLGEDPPEAATVEAPSSPRGKPRTSMPPDPRS